MSSPIHLDTHVVIWLFAGALHKLTPTARSLIDSAPELVVSPMVRLELQYLFEIGRVNEPAAVVLTELAARIGLGESGATLAAVASRATALSWTRDPFDRLIVANALVDGAILLTADALVRANEPTCRWD